MNDPWKSGLAAWLALAVVVVGLVEVVPASNRFLQWTLWLILIFLVLENAPKFGHIVDSLVAGLGR